MRKFMLTLVIISINMVVASDCEDKKIALQNCLNESNSCIEFKIAYENCIKGIK